jgi:UDP-N-acetylglucosamine transferase subunit ALG13
MTILDRTAGIQVVPSPRQGLEVDSGIWVEEIQVERPVVERPVVEHQVVVSVGTDHHCFDRLVGWMDAWLEARASDDSDPSVALAVTIQYGTSTPPRVAQGSSLLAHDELGAAMARATAIVTHGGPATIRDARSAGHRPLVVPRDPARGEHVDDHQIRFTRMLAEKGEIVLCREQDQLYEALDRAIADGSWLRLGSDLRTTETTESIARVGAILDEVMASRRRRLRRG